MGLRKKVLVVFALALLVLLVQMVALGLLGPQRNLMSIPWESRSHTVEQRTLKPHGMLREIQEVQIVAGPGISSNNKSLSATKLISPSLLTPSSHIRSSPRHRPASTVTPKTTPSSTTPKKVVPASYKDLSSVTSRQPVPAHLWNCDISREKDAMSAISRAKSPGCKELIHNVSCLHKAKVLYNPSIRRTCPLGPDPGTGVSFYPARQNGGEWAVEGVAPVRIVFLFSIHGRAVRQVKRLFKALYHSDHYYYIHVDSRSDYLYRQLYEDMSDYPNVYFPSWRMATIWGGASLLQMVLTALTDLEEVLTDWSWDYLINLSESDYPIRTNDDLVHFLTFHRGKNFVKIHGGELKKFIMKQGLDRTFVECDNHMWRVGMRLLPPDINVDGGSDWIAIHRNYSRYLVTGNDPLLVGLKRYYQFSLLPAESFFHTVLRNGHMCPTFVKTNLRVTNWNRKLGCRCQYKHVVDWCGCSPNDFLPQDIPRLKASPRHHFIARKFEAIVSQEVIEQLDAHLYGPLPPTTPGLKSYWESVFHMDDDITKPSDAKFTTYQSFLRILLKHLYSNIPTQAGRVACGIPHQAAVKEVSVVRKEDQLVGLVISVHDALSDKLNRPEFEGLFSPISHYKWFGYNHSVAGRILGLEVGSNWDGKESIFRNHGAILGVWDDPVLTLRLAPGEKGTVTVLWYDLLGVPVSSHSLSLEKDATVAYHDPKLEHPLRPGVWSVKVELGEKGNPLLAQDSFLVVPLTHTSGQEMTSPEKVNARHVPTGGKELLHPSFPSWRRNVSKSGTDLEVWLDKLVSAHWKLRGYCRSSAQERSTENEDSVCGKIPYCVSTEWSTLSPDPKSELPRLSEVGPNGRIR